MVWMVVTRQQPTSYQRAAIGIAHRGCISPRYRSAGAAPDTGSPILRANGKYAEIARQSMKENQPETYSQLEASGKLEPLLEQKDKAAAQAIVDQHFRNLQAGMQPGEAH